ncbi:MAG: hypothetical protein IPP56_13660 [Bacteroidetes bacterium]|nr:hypothetical protein [Bacteroidota bacterium]
MAGRQVEKINMNPFQFDKLQKYRKKVNADKKAAAKVCNNLKKSKKKVKNKELKSICRKPYSSFLKALLNGLKLVLTMGINASDACQK